MFFTRSYFVQVWMMFFVVCVESFNLSVSIVHLLKYVNVLFCDGFSKDFPVTGEAV